MNNEKECEKWIKNEHGEYNYIIEISSLEKKKIE